MLTIILIFGVWCFDEDWFWWVVVWSVPCLTLFGPHITLDNLQKKKKSLCHFKTVSSHFYIYSSVHLSFKLTMCILYISKPPGSSRNNIIIYSFHKWEELRRNWTFVRCTWQRVVHFPNRLCSLKFILFTKLWESVLVQGILHFIRMTTMYLNRYETDGQTDRQRGCTVSILIKYNKGDSEILESALINVSSIMIKLDDNPYEYLVTMYKILFRFLTVQ